MEFYVQKKKQQTDKLKNILWIMLICLPLSKKTSKQTKQTEKQKKHVSPLIQ